MNRIGVYIQAVVSKNCVNQRKNAVKKAGCFTGWILKRRQVIENTRAIRGKGCSRVAWVGWKCRFTCSILKYMLDERCAHRVINCGDCKSDLCRLAGEPVNAMRKNSGEKAI